LTQHCADGPCRSRDAEPGVRRNQCSATSERTGRRRRADHVAGARRQLADERPANTPIPPTEWPRRRRGRTRNRANDDAPKKMPSGEQHDRGAVTGLDQGFLVGRILCSPTRPRPQRRCGAGIVGPVSGVGAPAAMVRRGRHAAGAARDSASSGRRRHTKKEHEEPRPSRRRPTARIRGDIRFTTRATGACEASLQAFSSGKGISLQAGAGCRHSYTPSVCGVVDDDRVPVSRSTSAPGSNQYTWRALARDLLTTRLEAWFVCARSPSSKDVVFEADCPCQALPEHLERVAVVAVPVTQTTSASVLTGGGLGDVLAPGSTGDLVDPAMNTNERTSRTGLDR